MPSIFPSRTASIASTRFEGETVEEVLDYVQYDPKKLVRHMGNG